jgi:hypothetical protein
MGLVVGKSGIHGWDNVPSDIEAALPKDMLHVTHI